MRKLSKISLFLFVGLFIIICWANCCLGMVAKIAINPIFVDTFTIPSPEIVLVNLVGYSWGNDYSIIDTSFRVAILDSAGTDTLVYIYNGSRPQPLLDGFSMDTVYYDSNYLDSAHHDYSLYADRHFSFNGFHPLTGGFYRVFVQSRTVMWPNYVFVAKRLFSVGGDAELSPSYNSTNTYPFKGESPHKPRITFTFRNPAPSSPTVYFDSLFTCSLLTTSPPIQIFKGPNTVHDGFRVQKLDFTRQGGTLIDSVQLLVNWDTLAPLSPGNHKIKTTFGWFVADAFVGRAYRTDSFTVAISTPGGEMNTKATPTSPNNYSNRTPKLKTVFSLFTVDTTSGETTYYDADFLDTNLIVTLYPRGDTLFNRGVVRWGTFAKSNLISPGKLEFTIDWLDTIIYPPLSEDTSYWYEVKGGVWNYHSLLIYRTGADTTAIDTFLAEGTPPDMRIQSLNYVSTSPSFVLSAKDAKAGVNLDSLFVDLYAVDLHGEVPEDSVETRNYLKSLHVSDIDTFFGSTLVHTGVELEEVEGGKALDVWIYNGRLFDVRKYVDSLDIAYPDTLGPMDRAGNQIPPLFKRFYVDGTPPHIRSSSNSTHQTLIFEISDTSSGFKIEMLSDGTVDTTVLCAGINSASIKLYENFQLVTPDLTEYNSSTGVYSVHYSPSSENVWLKLDAEDKVGNRASYQNYYESDQLNLIEPHNYPNPFSPVSPIVDHRRTTIDPGVTKISGVEVVMDIYDLAGRFVASVTPEIKEDRIVGYWDGRTEDGTLVANGVYLCRIQAKDTAQNKTLTQVIKIAVAKNDQRIF